MIKNIWDKLFLQERPSIGLAFFRVWVAVTVGAHVLPTFFALKDNYLAGAFKELNAHFFPWNILTLVQKSPDALVVAVAALFCAVWFFFLIGYRTQLSCVLMTLGCYYFYALNAFVVGTLSWDILLVTLFLMCVTPYPGDYFSLDCLRAGNAAVYASRRPVFLQRLLQLQIAATYFYTGLYKITAQGNWITDNPVYYIMLYPPEGVTKYFLLRDWMAAHPQFCYVTGLLVVGVELLMPFLLFYSRTRVSALYLGFLFHVLLMLTLDVPAIFFFLFPPQLLLFIDPDHILKWIERKRAFYQQAPRTSVVYDGNCAFCSASVESLRVMDLFGRLDFVNYHAVEDLSRLHPKLTRDKAHSQLHVVFASKELRAGFAALRSLCLLLPMMYPLILLFYFPGAGVVGPALYRFVAKNRYLFHFNKKCVNNACFR